ncbi:uncharacterized protein LOC117605558 isoform X2 [Osmia lignaria lignaria]|uniref:uncharacterized protein LOC117605558 isoform X2 n=1 Tax=Osmia lignaria lignaria TaxID=1437193 RepID=UPI00147963E4|nr:uncharacterized protein LOC117605558 isoform X2 [Osmia lignaria]
MGGATAIAAFATTTIYKSRCWNEAVIDQIIEDGDTFYCESYKDINTDDRRLLSILDLKRTLCVQNKLTVNVSIEDAAYAGTFRSSEPTGMHLVKALDLFFKRHNAGILSSSVLNVAIWKDTKYYNIFDGQPRTDNCEPAADGVSGTAKLFLVKDLIGVLFIILEKSKVKNEPFVLYSIEISGVDHYTQPVDTDKPDKPDTKPQRRPSGYKVQETYRAVVQGSYHMTHPAIPQLLRSRTYLIIALAALVYSRLVNANKWTSALIDLIFNQSNIYFVDLVRVLDKDLNDNEFELRLDDIMGDIILGAYSAKVKIRTNVVPGYGQKKGKMSIDVGLREFFESQTCGLLEMKGFFYAIWRHDDTYYFMDPFACDDEGFRSGTAELDGHMKEGEAACVTMNSSINQMMETIIENTGSRDRDPFVIHGLRVLYVKTGTTPGGPLEKVIYREKGTNRRPQPPPTAPQTDTKLDEEIDMKPRIRPSMDKMRDLQVQCPDLMRDAELYMMTENEPRTYTIVAPEPPKEPEEELDEEEEEEEEETEREDEGLTEDEDEERPEEEVPEPVPIPVRGYRLINPNRLVLQGSKNCLDESFDLVSRGKQGLITALTAIAYSKLKEPTKWRNMDIDQVIEVGHKTYGEVVDWIRKGRPEAKEKEIEGEGEEEEEEDLEDEGEQEEQLLPIPSHMDMTMLPVRLKLGENDVFYKTKMKIIQGEANPLANLAEALECYFNRYPQLVLENKRLMYGIWKEGTTFFLFNPYGSDEEGWRLRDHPASFAVVGTLNELIDLLYGIMEFNDPSFIIHFVGLDAIQPGLYASEEPIELPEESTIEQFKTKFLPITDEDLSKLEAELEEPEVETQGADTIEMDEEEEEEEEEEDEGRRRKFVVAETEKPIIDPLLEVKEQEQPDAPYRLNLILLTSNMKIFEESEEDLKKVHEQIALEKLKYDHPPPYVMPSNKTLIKLLEAKRAKRSVPSLVSRFSIDSRLDVKKKGGMSILMSRSTTMMSFAAINDDVRPSKMIKLSPKRYLYSRILPICLMPLRAINDMYIQDQDREEAMKEELEKENEDKRDDFVGEDIPDVPVGVRIRPQLIPLGPTIKTPNLEKRTITCLEKKKRKCLLAKGDEGDGLIEKILCNTEDLLLELFFPGFKAKDQPPVDDKTDVISKTSKKTLAASTTTIRKSTASTQKKGKRMTDATRLEVIEDGIRILQGNMCLENRAANETCHFKSCFFSALLCVLAKIKLDPDHFRPSTLDQLIFLGDKIYQRTGRLRYKPYRWFQHVEILDMIYNAITKQSVYADPENCQEDELSFMLEYYLEKDKTGILVFSNCSYAFWTANERYYLFDPYACDEKGNASEEGFCCLMEFCDLAAMLEKIERNIGKNINKPYRIYTVCIGHMESKKRKKKRKKKIVRCVEKKTEQEVRAEEPPEVELSTESEVSLIEQTDWVKTESKTSLVYDMTIVGFSPIKHYNASMLDVIVLENEITTPSLAPFKKSSLRLTKDMDEFEAVKLLVRRKVYDRKFKPHSAVTTPLDLCVIAWSLIHDPITWSVRTVRGLFEASIDYTFDSILATEDSTVSEMTDGLLPEFEIANYVFRVVFVPLHYGTLYSTEGWNLSMSLQKIFETPGYTGVVIVCGDAHVGVTKKDDNCFAWWTIRKTKTLRFVTSTDMKEFLKLIVKEINEPNETTFVMRVITVSYAHKVDPDCSDTKGLHEPVVPSTSLPEVHRMPAEPYDLEAIFRPTVPDSKPIFILGSVALSNRDAVTEPKVKRCYFVAVLAVMVKRDIVQSPMPGMIDKILEVAESVYREFSEPKFHIEHILRNVTVMNRIFDFRDCASSLITLTFNPRTLRTDFYVQVRKHLRRYFKSYSSGIIHFTNCCYGFWYSRATNAYYYVDPYQCNEKGRKVSSGGKACLCIFSTVCQMVKNMCLNQFEETTGFFIHQLHVDSVNVPPFKTFKEDPMWLYLDYHWNFRHAPNIVKSHTKKRKKEAEEGDETVKQFWNNYAVEVSNLIYSAWGTIGSYDSRFGDRAGKNQAAICVAVLAMQYLSHPSRWGPAILDSAVICGDSYYTESLKSSMKKYTKHFNRFNLQTCFKIFPHSWTIQFRESICGILYGTKNRMTLATALVLAFQESPNVLIECNKITLAALAAKDGYYVADPCWVGPPLFNKDHGAIYVLRCRNMNSLVYAVVKMLNTNQRLNFRLTPVVFTFEQEDFNFMDNKTRESKRKVLLEPVRITPGKVDEAGPPIPGAHTTPEGDSYLSYNKNFTLGKLKSHELENPEWPSVEPVLEEENRTSMHVSTTWHINFGQAAPLDRATPVFDSQAFQHVPEECENRVVDSYEPLRPVQRSVTDFLTACNDYPRVLDFAGNRVVTQGPPLHCTAARSFLTETAREEFRSYTADMAKNVYKTYKHRLPKRSVHSVTKSVSQKIGGGEYPSATGIHTITEEEAESSIRDSPDTGRETEYETMTEADDDAEDEAETTADED